MAASEASQSPSFEVPPPRPQLLPPVATIGFSCVVCAYGGSRLYPDLPLSLTNPSPGLLVGALLGGLLGAALTWDSIRVRKIVDERLKVPLEPTDAVSAAPPGKPTDALAIVMLLIPLAVAPLLWFPAQLQVTPLMAYAAAMLTVLATAVLGYFDTRQLQLANPPLPRDLP